ncbi:MAG TPA: Uma2 family endonuclease [Pyrinomonadaceae bacterium]|nr:Uma2 family endonuclease [Pyrinomonadaceae bacterium]
MNTKLKILTIADWEAMPHGDGNRYEIIEGERFVSRSPGLTHERVLFKLILLIGKYLEASPVGEAVANVGVILSNISAVIPDLIVFLNEQSETIISNDRLKGPPALVIEILSPGPVNIQRDRLTKLQLYDKHGVSEYWIVDPPNMSLERYVRQGTSLVLLERLENEDILSTTTLPGFSCKVSEIFRPVGK